MGLYKRGATWWMRFSWGKEQIRKSCGTTNRKLAEKIYDKVRGELVEGRLFPRALGEEMTFRELKERYLSEHSPKKSKKQYIRDRGIFENHLLPYFGDYLLSEITSDLVSAYKAKRRQEGAKPGTINRELVLLKHCFSLKC